MIYALREINQRTPRALPNFTLGYDIYDTCGDVSIAIRATLQLLKNQSDPQMCLVPANFQSVLSEPKTKAVIGERYSEVSIAVARVVALSSVAQISHGSTSEQLSRKLKFPSFLRTISSDEHQTKAISELVRKFNWTAVAIVGSDDEYGKYGSDRLEANLRVMKNICIEFINILPGYFSKNTSQVHKMLNELVDNINKSPAEAIIMFTKDTNVNVIMEAAIKHNLNRTWIASDSWSTSSLISTLPGIEKAGEVFGFISKRNELLTEIKKVNFTVNTTRIFFDSNGDPSLGYDILYWNMTESKKGTSIKTIGEYWPNGKIEIHNDFVGNKSREMVTAYNCSKTCEPGQMLKKQSKRCCHDCVPCAEGEFSAGNGDKCETCGQKKYSSPQRNMCFKKTPEFLDWSDPFIIILSCLQVLGIITTIVFAILFAIYHRTPVVKAVGGYLCFLELFSLLVCFCLAFSFVGKPTAASCMVGLPVFGIAFSLCISCILANLLQILVGFNFDLKIRLWIKKLNQPAAVVIIVSGIQLALCVPWLYFYPPFPYERILKTTILLQCHKGSDKLFIAMLVYNAFWALSCFLFAFKGKQLPDLYKNASLITTSMMLFLIIWILFIPIYISLFGSYKQAIESAAILISSYSILCCHLAPKCYIIIFRKEINNENAITEYIRKHFEQKNLTVVTS
ncbi:G-protein coupled receptor family C group 6 member A-like [Sparus aurata]|uniref:G-protein coupled receptor family C group 6 member A-like n=1 Tax=Sparus aurata TaxID=8175 RepID=UPI0011C11BE4|nr:G-protein coupled receptor family C group 6 member A-like [Sparus aurata]